MKLITIVTCQIYYATVKVIAISKNDKVSIIVVKGQKIVVNTVFIMLRFLIRMQNNQIYHFTTFFVRFILLTTFNILGRSIIIA